jgi:glutathione S-transferase
MKYVLYYWDVPFRGVFPELMLEEAGVFYERRDASDIYPEKVLKIHTAGMAPPYLYDLKKKTYLAQMPAIMLHLAREYHYLPKRAETFDLAVKTIMDCHDVLLEITNSYGNEMWTPKDWKEFRNDRLAKWMKIFELTGKTHGLKKDSGFLLGSQISVSDIAATALFGTMTWSFPELREDMEKNAPHVLRLIDRIEARPLLKKFLGVQRAKYGKAYCGGEIEKSLRKMMSSPLIRSA